MRRVFVGSDIVVKLVMKNLLTSVQLEIKNVRVICKFKAADGSEMSEEESQQCYVQES